MKLPIVNLAPRFDYTTAPLDQHKINSYMKHLLLFAVLLSTLLGYTQNRPVKAKGPQKTKEITLESFHKIDISHNANISVVCGAMPMVKISAAQNILDLISVDIEQGTLLLKSDNWIESWTTSIQISVPFISDLDMNGSGNISVSNLQTDRFNLVCNSGNINLTGKVNHLSISGSGSGNLNTSGLSAKTVRIAKSGANNVRLNVSDTLFVDELAGSISYDGNPVVITDTGVDKEYIMTTEERDVSKSNLVYVKLVLKNNTNQKQDFYIKGPKGHPFSYGFPMRAGTTRAENVPVGTKIWKTNKLGMRDGLLLTVTEANKNKTINLFP